MTELLPSRETMIFIGTIVAVTVMVLLVIIEYKFTVRMIVVSLMTVVSTIPGTIFGELARKLTYGEWLNASEFINNFSVYEGTHYVGRAFYTICIGFLLWKMIMRKETGNLSKKCRNRFLDILSVFMLIQIIAGRLGCISEGCCLGKAYYGVLSMYNNNLGYKVYPAVQTELTIEIITLIISIPLYIKRKNVFSVFCIGYAVALLIAECMYDSAGTVRIMGLTVIQQLAIILLIIGVVYAYIFGRQTVEYINKNRGNKLPRERRKSL